MQFSRLTVAVTLSSALLVTACTGQGESGEETSGGSTTVGAQDTATATGDPVEETTDDTTATATPTDDDTAATTEMTTDEGQAALGVDEAEQVATTLLEARHEAYTASDDIEGAQEKAFAGTALNAAAAETRLRDEVGEGDDEPEELTDPNVLAISRADDADSVLILVQTVPDSGVPMLHLMESPSGAEEDFRITWEASMLAGTELPSFDARSVGTPVVRSGRGDLSVNPREILKSLAAYVAWPQPDTNPGINTSGYGDAVRTAAKRQAEAVAAQATLREKNWLVSDDVRTLLFEDGSGLVIGSLLRDTTFTPNADAILTPPETFLVFAEDDEITEQAVLRTSVFVAMRVPSNEQDFKHTLIAAREQLVDAWGS